VTAAAPETWAVVLAAGEGKRMRSARPKVLHPLAGRPLLLHALAVARSAGVAGTVVVVGRGGDAVRAALAGEAGVRFAEQPEPRGTGDALLAARPALPPAAGVLLVLSGDVPLVGPATVARLLARHRQARAAATVLTARLPDPAGYGRVVRLRGRLRAIVEERDATPAQRRVREVNAGTYAFAPAALWPALARLAPDNAQGERYLTDAVRSLARAGRRVETVAAADPLEVAGVNDRVQLAALERVVRQRTLERLMREGVTVLDPATTWVDADVRVGRDTVLYPGVRLEGRTAVGENCVVGPGSLLADATLGDGVTVRAYCVVAEAEVGAGASVGPFAHLRPGTVLEAGARVGTFVELKQASLGRDARVPHLAYVGDASVGEGANLGAGTITCNYDGVRKHRTDIGAGAFVGTNASLVAPVRIGAGAYVGAGSVITKDVPPGALAVERSHQVVKEGWAARRRAAPGPARRGATAPHA
jgi:bifunctional UDP-N-acetylglucosamine pyrophosphorylase/glucosamine-1-phosphate N-acetyltransferase